MSDAPPATGEFQYVRDEDRAEYRRFCEHHIGAFPHTVIDEVWHYTSADGLIGILKCGKLWTTQVACLNDSLEQRYFGRLIHEELKKQMKTDSDQDIAVLFRVADEALSNDDFAATGHFVACFSEVEDDLGQWRGYGGGECGYAIGFQFDGIREALRARPNARFLQVYYEDGRHALIADVVRMAQQYFRQGIARGVPSVERWAREFLSAFAWELDMFACFIKHPKFACERERRIATLLQDGEWAQLEFRQKRTLLARHLPISMTTTSVTTSRLPITRIYVGPGAAQRVSQVSVGDILRKFGYEGVPVELSKVPYRVP